MFLCFEDHRPRPPGRIRAEPRIPNRGTGGAGAFQAACTADPTRLRTDVSRGFEKRFRDDANVRSLDVSPFGWESFGMDESGEFVSTEAAAQLLGVSAQRVRTLLRDGTVEGRRQGRGWLVQAEDLERYRRDRESSGRRRSDRAAKPSVSSDAQVEVVSVEGLSPAQLRARLQELQTRVEELSRRNAELEEQLRRVRLLAELLRTETPVPAARG